MHPDIERVLFTEDQINVRIRELAGAIERDYADNPPLMVGILKGSVLFLGDLVKRVNLMLELDFMAISSYGESSKSSGVVRIIKDLEKQVEGRAVLLVEDIIDTGLTLKYLQDLMVRRRAASVKVASLLDKVGRREVDIHADYCGFTVPDEFIVGYGLDYAERYRNLPYVGVLRRDIYAN